MRKLALLFSSILLITLFSNPSFAQKPYQVKDLDVLLMYYKLSGEEIPWKDVAQYYPEYQKAKDEFARQDVLDKLKLKIQEEMNALVQRKPLVIISRFEIDEYDFDKGAFPLGISDNTYFPFGSTPRAFRGLAITFTNADQFTHWIVAREEARKITQKIGDRREVVAIIEFVPAKAFNDKLDYLDTKIVQVEISKITFETPNRSSIIGTVLPNSSK
jgi:hypothetical protein